MILLDFSSLFHRALFTSINETNPHKNNGKYVTDDFIPITIYRIIQEIFENYKTYKNTYNTFVICNDDKNAPYWRKEVYPAYKATRKKARDKSEVDFNEVYKHINILLDVLCKYSPFKLISVPGAEADDIISVLAHKYAVSEKILILSPDKDFKQLHKLGDIKQYSALTNKWIINDHPDEWEKIHCCLGDVADNVPKITDFSVFSENFKKYYNGTELDFYNLTEYEKQKILENYNILNDKEELDIFKSVRFGESTLNKKIKEYGSLDAFINSNPIYRLNYERNKILVLDSGIPAKIEAEIIKQYVDAPTLVDINMLKKYFNYYNLKSCMQLFEQLMNEMSKPVQMTKFNVNFDNIF